MSSTHMLLLWTVSRQGLESVTSPNYSIGEVGQGQWTRRQGSQWVTCAEPDVAATVRASASRGSGRRFVAPLM